MKSEVVLVTGAGGQLGHALVAALGNVECHALSSAELDITDRSAVLNVVATLRPTAVINAAAYTAVDDCETNEVLALKVNAFGVRNLNEACAKNGSFLVQVSTDYVFDGNKSEPYNEWDQTNPQSAYGRSKLGGESEVSSGNAIARTAWLFGDDGNNIVRTILALAANDKPMKFVTDQVGNPTYAPDLAAGLVQIALQRLPGTFHLTNSTSLSWYDFARAILERGGFSPELVSPIVTSEMSPPRPAKRPANSRLNGSAARAAGIEAFPPIEDALGRFEVAQQ